MNEIYDKFRNEIHEELRNSLDEAKSWDNLKKLLQTQSNVGIRLLQKLVAFGWETEQFDTSDYKELINHMNLSISIEETAMETPETDEKSNENISKSAAEASENGETAVEEENTAELSKKEQKPESPTEKITIFDCIIVQIWKMKNENSIEILNLLLTMYDKVHSYTLALLLLICFNIYDGSEGKSLVELTSKATLTQIVNQIFINGNKEMAEDLKVTFSFLIKQMQGTAKAQALAIELTSTSLFKVKIEKPLHYLLGSLVVQMREKAVSSNIKLFEENIKLFIIIVTDYRHLFKKEIEEIFVLYLEIMDNDLYQQKSLILQNLLVLAKDDRILLDLYGNYDCQMGMFSICEKIIQISLKITQKQSKDKKQHRLFLRALVLLVQITRSLVTVCDQPQQILTEASSNNIAEEEDDALTNLSRKQLFKKGISIFNTRSPKKGLSLLVQNGFVEDTPLAKAEFLRNTPELDKKMIGDVLGESADDFVQTMHAFIDLYDFKDMEFVPALRFLLQGFRLPGEAQKIDRIVEKFADRYYAQMSQGLFGSADAVYTLAFSVIMLNTDLHSAQIKKRMDVDGFIKNNQGAFKDTELPIEYLTAIYNEIKQEEIILNGEQLNPQPMIRRLFNLVPDDEEILSNLAANSKNQLSEKIIQYKTYYSKGLAKVLFQSLGWGLLASLALTFERVDVQEDNKGGPNMYQECLDGLQNCIKLSCWFDMYTIRDAYLAALAKGTNLTAWHELSEKNEWAIGGIIKIALEVGEYLGDGWAVIFAALARLDTIQRIVYLRTGKSPTSNIQNNFNEMVSPRELVPEFVVKMVDRLEAQETLLEIDKVFVGSVNLSGVAIVSFFTACCKVSLQEVGDGLFPDGTGKGMYLVQKLVEISYYNMHRIRYEWKQIWSVLQPHFITLGCNSNLTVSQFAVDSLRQLGMKFLERKELEHYATQLEFLASFEGILKRNSAHAVRELILNSLSQMIQARASRIRSGWKSILATIGKAARDPTIEKHAFGLCQTIFKTHLEEVISTGGFVDLVFCLAEFAVLNGSGPEHDELVMSSIKMLQSSLQGLVSKSKGEKNENNQSANQYLVNGLISEDHFHWSWVPVLQQFARVISEGEGVLVRTHTMEILFDTLRGNGQLFAGPYWKVVQRNVVAPIFEDLYEQGGTIKESTTAVLIHGCRMINNLITEHFTILENNTDGGREFLWGCIDIMIEMMAQTDDKLTSTGQTCFRNVLTSNVGKFVDSSWNSAADRIESAFQKSMPVELVKCKIRNHSNDVSVPDKILEAVDTGTKFMGEMSLDSLEFEKTVFKCVAHLELLVTMREFCGMEINGRNVIQIMPINCRTRVLDELFLSYGVARLFNSRTSLRQAIHKRGWVTQLPNLVKQETTALTFYLSLVFRVALVDKSILPILSTEILDLFSRFKDLIGESTKSNRDVASFSPVIISVFSELVNNPSLWQGAGAINDNLSIIYQRAVELIAVENLEMRNTLREFLSAVGKHIFQ